ncbi:hypothetical protein IQ07DRAFT_264711 [Pyrenochaeta sp. DS3sAY3a]|nr:hypothetical protein IQ07DRAFT_264711 [Pyrenochaeta sp. DS3sAY3a]
MFSAGLGVVSSRDVKKICKWTAAGYNTVGPVLGGAGRAIPDSMGRPVLSPGRAVSCVRDVSGHMLQTRWAAGHACSCVCVRTSRSQGGSAGLRSPSHQSEQFTPAPTRACCTPTSTLSTVHKAAGSSVPRASTDAPQNARRRLDRNQKRYWLIVPSRTLYAAVLRKAAYRCRLNMYLFVPADPPTTLTPVPHC